MARRQPTLREERISTQLAGAVRWVKRCAEEAEALQSQELANDLWEAHWKLHEALVSMMRYRLAPGATTPNRRT